MTELYLIGGTSLAGKTTNTLKFLKERQVATIMTDSVRRVLWKVLSPNTHPDLFTMFTDRQRFKDCENPYSEDPNYFMRSQMAQSRVVWEEGVTHCLQNNLHRHIGTIVEGIAVLPEYVAALDPPPTAAVFLGNQNVEAQSKYVIPHVHEDPDHWMYGWTDRKITSYLEFTAFMGRHIQQSAESLGYPYVEMSDGEFHERCEYVTDLLLEGGAMGEVVGPVA